MMQKEDIVEKIGGLLAELSQQYDELKENPEGANEADLALFAINTKYLYGHVRIWKKLAVISEKSKVAESPIESKVADKKFWVNDEPTDDSKEFSSIEESPIAGVDIPEIEEPEQQEELINEAAEQGSTLLGVNEDEEPDAEADSEIAEESPEESAQEEEQEKIEEEESPVMRYVGDHEVEETLFTPATADLDSEVEEYSLGDSDAKEEEDKAAETEDAAEQAGEIDESADAEEVVDEKEEPEEVTDEVGYEDEANTNTESEVEASIERDEADLPAEEVTDAPDLANDEQTEDAAPQETEPEAHEAKEVVIEEKEVIIPQAEVPEAQPKARPMSLNDLFSAQRKIEQEQQNITGSNAAKASASPASAQVGNRIQDFKSAVSLNDKLLFIKDLFNGYSLAYSEAMDLLARYETFGEADAFLQETYAGKNNWSSKQATVDRFYALLQQKYTS